MSLGKLSRITRGMVLFVALMHGVGAPRPAIAQNDPAQDAPKTEAREPVKDYYQRSLEIYEFRKAAKSGTARGEEIFYYKCWFCHNEYQKGAVQLKGLYSRPRLISGQPVNDETIKAQIRNGGPGMAAYKYVLNDADLSDLMSYLREKCCWNSESVPANPAYRAH
jgi:mono/diheme cytochrome c family protein